MDKLIVAKIGGKIIDDSEKRLQFLKQFCEIDSPKILVHGGGKVASTLAESLGVEVQMVEGRRITDQSMLDVVTMVYGGLINKTIVAQLQGLGCNAAGLTGADANIILSNKREVAEIDYGYVGDIREVNIEPLYRLLSDKMTPVLAPLTHDGNGTLLNTNADTIAASIAREMSLLYAVHLYYCFEKPGVLESVEDDESVIPALSYDRFQEMKSANSIADGMIPKLDTGFEALRNGVSNVTLCSAGNLGQIVEGSKGTRYTKLFNIMMS